MFPANLPRALCCAGALAAVVTPLCAAPEPPEPPRLRVALTTSMTLPDGVRDVLAQEVRAIWRRAGVEIDWRPPREAAALTSGIRVLVVSAAGSAASDEHQWPVAELLRDDLGQPVAIASLAAARLADGPGALVARRLGVVLGRAVAHEIGHYLLNTTRHARHGLMRARIDAGDFVDLREGGFGLDPGEAVWARAALTREPADVLRVARYVYVP